MDNTEYTIKKDEIRSLIAQKEYAQAAEIADTIDWRRVRSVMMLCTVSDLYKINRRYEDAKNMLLLAYEFRPGGRSICYSLCELCIKMEEFVEAVGYYKEFVQAAPKDPDRYVLKYKLYEAQDVSLEERIEVLKELKNREYREKWLYELAYLYHRIGQATLCVEECDDLILWFGDGKYVYKAMELKMLHQPLSPAQQEKYDHRLDGMRTREDAGGSAQSARASRAVERPYVREQAAGYDQRNEQYQENMPQPEEQYRDYGQQFEEPYQGYMPQPDEQYPGYDQHSERQVQQGVGGNRYAEQIFEAPTVDMEKDSADLYSGETMQNAESNAIVPDIQVPIMDMGQYNTMNLQAELAAGLEEVLGREDGADIDSITQSIIAPMFEVDTDRLDLPDDEETEELVENAVETAETEVFFGETGEIGKTNLAMQEEIVPELMSSIGGDTKVFEIVRSGSEIGLQDYADGKVSAVEPVEQKKPIVELVAPDPVASDPLPSTEDKSVIKPEQGKDREEKQPDIKLMEDETADLVMNQMRMESSAETQAMIAQPPKELADVLTQESDGQISLLMSETEAIEKQITGQMSIQDILAEWERMKQASAEKRKEELQQQIQQQTGNMFTEFEAAVRDGLLEQLENETIAEETEPESGQAGSVESGEEQFEEIAEIEDVSVYGQFAGTGDATEYEGESDGLIFEGSVEEPETYEGPEGSAEEVQAYEGAEENIGGPETYEGAEGSAEEVQADEGIEENIGEPETYEGPEGSAGEVQAYGGAEENIGEPETYEGTEGSVEEVQAYEGAEENIGEPETYEGTEGSAEEVQADEGIEENIGEPETYEGTEGSKEEPETYEGAEGSAEEVQAYEGAEENIGEPEASEGTEGSKEDSETIKETEESVEGDQVSAETGEVKETAEPAAVQEIPKEDFAAQSAGDGTEKKDTGEQDIIAQEAEEQWEDTEEASPDFEDAYDLGERTRESADDGYGEQEENSDAAEQEEQSTVRALTREERELYAPYIQTRAAREQLVRAIDGISMAAYTGNIIITGEEGVNTVGLAKNMIREIQAADRNFSGKVAKISGQGLNQRDVRETLLQLKNGALIVQKASGMSLETAAEMYRTLQQDNLGIIVALEDTKKGIAKLFTQYSPLEDCFTARMDVEALSNDTLASFGRKYAREMEYSIDELGMLALHKRIEEMQTIDHVVTVVEVKEIVDGAIRHARRKNLGHFMDVLFARRYDEEDMIILTEKDFV